MTTVMPLEGSADALRSRVAGYVATNDDALYDRLREPWNRAFVHRPSIIVVPASVADVSVAVRHAASIGLPVYVEATGHGVLRPSHGGMLILTHGLDSVEVDGDTWTARIGSGARWKQVLGPVTEVGLAPLLGSSPDVGAVGYTLGGGMGWLARKYGLAADHVRSIEIVTADGAIRRTSPETEPDLFWALRGAGAGSFGVVTSIEIDLVPVTSLYAGNLLYPAELAHEVADRYRSWLDIVPDELTSALTFMNYPDDEPAAELRSKSFTIVRGAFVGPAEDGERLLDFFRQWRKPEIDRWGSIPFRDIATVSNDPIDPLPALGTSEWFDDLDEEVIDILVSATFDPPPPAPLVMAELRHAGGAVAREPEHPNAYPGRAHLHVLESVGVTPTPESVTALIDFHAAVRAQLQPYTAGGAYLNFLDGDEKAERTPEAFDAVTWQRLLAIKLHYDSGNVFSHGLPLW